MRPEERLRQLCVQGELELPAPGAGRTGLRHARLMEFGREDLSLARLAEAHLDAVAIIQESGHTRPPGLYGVWAAETRADGLNLECSGGRATLTGSKMFCTGAGLIDRALITVAGRLVDVDLRAEGGTLSMDYSAWKTSAFAGTNTATVTFNRTPVARVIGENDWYLKRPGFWHGACGPAACWAGGAAGLLDYAVKQARDEAHGLAHLGAMRADVWAMRSYLETAGVEIDDDPGNYDAAMVRALTVRHLIEQASTQTLQRLGRAFGPRPLAFDEAVSRRCQELELYIRQSHAERDLESLGRGVRLHGAVIGGLR